MERAIAEYKSIGFDDNGQIILNEKNKPSIPIAPFAKKWQIGRKAFYERLYEKLPMSAQAGRKPLLTAYEEQVLLEYVVLRARMGYGLSSGKLHRYIKILPIFMSLIFIHFSSLIREYLVEKGYASEKFSRDYITKFLKKISH
jgi:hypothetical protein